MLALNEIRRRAYEFVLNWKEKVATAREEADAQTFETEFLYIFGVPRNKIAIFEHKVKLLDGSSGYIDLFWKGYILIEMKSPSLGAHYTSEENILKLIHPLFLDELWERFEKAKKLGTKKARTVQLNALHEHIASLKFLDPACGCGNFLVVAYSLF